MNTHEEGTSTTKLNAAVSASLAASKFIVLAVLIASIAAIAVHFTRNKQTFFVESISGELKEVFPLTEPNVTPTSLINWITLAVTSAYTLDFYEYEESLADLKEYFTVDGYQNFLNALNASGSLKKIIKDKLIVTAVPIDTAIVLQEGIMNNVYTWKIQIPLLINYQGASTTSTKKTVAVSVLVIRVPTSQAPKGIGIAQIVDGDYNAKY
jgi:intracellular multiplication protein IcmL